MLRASAVIDPIEDVLQEARSQRNMGNVECAEQKYGQAAGLARASGHEAMLAHALRHLSDLAHQRGAAVEAFDHASEAVALYRKLDDQLGLANAIRMLALSSPGQEAADGCWREARALYSALGVEPGVSECDRQLARTR